MTEREHDEQLLAELLRLPDEDAPGATADPILSRREEQRLLREANQAGPSTLAPAPPSGLAPPPAPTLPAEIVEAIRRHPLPALLLGIGLAYLLTRRRR